MERAQAYHGDNVEPGSSQLPTRQKTSHENAIPKHPSNPATRRREQYTIAWICALPIELTAARAMLDEEHESLPVHKDDFNTYTLGSIKGHNVVIAVLPKAHYGTNNAAIVSANLKRTFTSIRCCLMVGVGAGVPTGEADIRLGDIVVATKVIQYDLGKWLNDGRLESKALHKGIHFSLGTAVSGLIAKQETDPIQVPSFLLEKLPQYGRPSLPDRLFQATYNHSSTTGCDDCDDSKLVQRSPRNMDGPMIHFGGIGSSNQVVRDARKRDDLAKEVDLICFEMEAAGLMDLAPCLPVRGICDYADSHKDKNWQRYAAATAAAYAREFLGVLPITEASMGYNAPYVPNPHKESSLDHRRSLLESLSFDQIDYRRSNIENAHYKTCQWFLDHWDYKDWLDPEQLAVHHGFLWVRGKPGSGKSTLMKFVFSSMTRERNNRHGVIASFFFNARGTKLERSTLGMYRSLLLQLLKGYTDLQAVLDDQKPIAKSQDCPSLPDLKVLLDRAVLSLGQRPFTCFVDALDECDEQQAMDMAFSFEQLSELAASEEIPLRICFSSRHYPDFDIQRGIRVILENQQGHADDLKKYVEAQLRIRDHTLKKDLEARIIQKAAGVFLWIVLVVGILNRHMRRGGQQPKKRLVEIPSGLSALFKDILTRDDENMAEFRLCVLWILCAKEPLGAESLLHAVWSGLYLEGQADSEPPDLTTAAGFVTGSSKGLAEVMDQSGFHRVQFIHESVPDFLIKDHGLRELWPKLGPNWESLAHETLKKCCEAYMRYYLMCESTRNKLKRLETKEKYPFLMYASYHVLAHADAAAYAIPQGDFLSRFALRDWRTIINMTRLLPVEIYTSGTNLTWFLVEKGYSELIRAIPKQDRNHPSGCRFSVRHPLLGALLWGRKDAAAALLDLPSTIHNGVDIVEGLLQLHSSDYTGHTPLSFAAERGRIDLVELLLNDANIDEVDDDGQTALSRALCRGHEHVARLLIDRGAAITGGSRDKLTSLLLAVCNGYDGITRLLVEKGADVKPRGGDDRPLYTHISRSPRLDFEAIAKLVIEDGANINAMYPGGERPLYIALDRCHEGMVRLLIENGANIDAWYLLGKKPLDIALDRCHEGIVRLLIEKGVDVNARGWGKKTALIRASEQGHEDIVRLLIEKGADVNACGLLDNTALTIASEQGHEGIVRLLIENGVDLHGRGLGMMTALMRASKKGHEDIVRLLIENAR